MPHARLKENDVYGTAVEVCGTNNEIQPPRLLHATKRLYKHEEPREEGFVEKYIVLRLLSAPCGVLLLRGIHWSALLVLLAMVRLVDEQQKRCN
jgi:hypothetical protein